MMGRVLVVIALASSVAALVKIDSGASCLYEGTLYVHGSSFMDKDNCNNCFCNNGIVGCTKKLCIATCLYEGKTYQHGATFMDKDGCNTCSCDNGAVVCTLMLCTASCLYEGNTYEHGASFMDKDGCNTCSCDNGAVACTEMFCYKPSVPLYPRASCIRRHLKTNLNGTVQTTTQRLQGLTFIQRPTVNPNSKYATSECSATAVMKVNFQKIMSGELFQSFGCLQLPYCGRRMLKIQMALSPSVRAGHMFNFGDSATNDGYNGDYSTQSRDAELHATYPNVTQYSGDLCEPTVQVLQAFNDVLAPPASLVTIWISNEHVRIQNNNGFDRRLCHDCLWALNGQVDTEGTPNEDVYLAFNRVVYSTSRVGVGICSVDISWECPPCGGRC